MSCSTSSKASAPENPFQFYKIIRVTHQCATAYTKILHHVKLQILKQEKQAKSKSRGPSCLCRFSVRLHNFSGYAAKEAIASISSWSRSASMNTSRFSPSMTSAMEWWVIPTRWSVTRPCGKLYVLIRSDLSPLPICKQVRPWKPVVNNLTWGTEISI